MRILATKLKNTLPKQYHCTLRDVKVNGDKRGCVGFIQFEDKTVYVNTEACGTLGYMVRTAAHGKDYIGGRNHWAKDSAALTLLICELINQNHFPA